MTAILALYRGPDRSNMTLQKALVHWAICIWTLSRHSHAELCIDGVCYSASAMDKGVRSKVIDITSGRWDLYLLRGVDKAHALEWFNEHEGQKYDWPGIVSWVIPFVRQHATRWVCFEAVGAMLQIAKPHRLTARRLIKWSQNMGNNNGV